MPFEVVYYLFLCVAILLLLLSTWVVEHGMVPLLVPEGFPPVEFSMQAHVFSGDTWHHPYISTCFCGKRFTSLVSLLFMECKLHSGNFSPEA